MKEKTTSASKTGLHFGHLKACAQNSLLTEFESSIAHIPYVSGYTPQQWKEGTIVMIKKREGLNNIKTYAPLFSQSQISILTTRFLDADQSNMLKTFRVLLLNNTAVENSNVPLTKLYIKRSLMILCARQNAQDYYVPMTPSLALIE